MKPGYLTTEFYVTLLTQVWGVIALVGGFDVNNSTANSAIKVGGLLAAAVASGFYSHSRGKAKSAPVTNVTSPQAPVAVATTP